MDSVDYLSFVIVVVNGCFFGFRFGDACACFVICSDLNMIRSGSIILLHWPAGLIVWLIWFSCRLVDFVLWVLCLMCLHVVSLFYLVGFAGLLVCLIIWVCFCLCIAFLLYSMSFVVSAVFVGCFVCRYLCYLLADGFDSNGFFSLKCFPYY